MAVITDVLTVRVTQGYARQIGPILATAIVAIQRYQLMRAAAKTANGGTDPVAAAATTDTVSLTDANPVTAADLLALDTLCDNLMTNLSTTNQGFLVRLSA